MDKVYELKRSEHILLTLDKQRVQCGNLCDLLLTVGDAKVYAHRNVLAASSSYFEGMFSGAFKDSREAQKTIDLSLCIPDITYVEDYLSFVYRGQLKLTPENLAGMVHLADFLMSEDVKMLCQRFIKETLTLSCCLDYLRISCQFRLSMALDHIFGLVCSRFHDHLVHDPEVLHLPPFCLHQMIEYKAFRYLTLRPILFFLAAWVNADPEGHKEDGATDGDGSGEKDGGDVSCSEYRKARLDTACDVIDAHIATMTSRDLDLECGDLHSLMEGSTHVVMTLAAQCLQKLDADSKTSESGTEVDKQLTKNVSVSLESADRPSSAGSGGVCCDELNLGSSSRPDGCRSGATVTSQGSDRLGERPTGSSVNQGLNVTDHNNSTQSTAGPGVSSDSHQPAPGQKRSRGSQLEENDNCMQPLSKRKKEGCGLMQSHLPGDNSSSGKAWSKGKVSYETEAMAEVCRQCNQDKADMLVAFVPDEETVNVSMANGGLEDHPHHDEVGMVVCVYHVQRRTWFRLGATTFPGSFRESDAWRVAVARDKAYFISVPRQSCHVLNLRTMVWGPANCDQLFMPFRYSRRIACPQFVHRVIPITVNDQLYALVAYRLPELEGIVYEDLSMHRYYLLNDSGLWQTVARVSHKHTMSLPLNMISVDGDQVYMARLTTPDSSVVEVHDCHVFNTISGQVSAFRDHHLCQRDVHLFVHGGLFHIIDSWGLHSSRSVHSDTWKKEQRSPELADITNVVRVRSHHPSLNHMRCRKGDSSWEFQRIRSHQSKLAQLRLGEDHKISSIEHPPPPFGYVSCLTTGRLSKDLVHALEPCRFIHAGVGC